MCHVYVIRESNHNTQIYELRPTGFTDISNGIGAVHKPRDSQTVIRPSHFTHHNHIRNHHNDNHHNHTMSYLDKSSHIEDKSNQIYG